MHSQRDYAIYVNGNAASFDQIFSAFSKKKTLQSFELYILILFVQRIRVSSRYNHTITYIFSEMFISLELICSHE